MTDTIFALSSGSPPAAIAIVRVSGPGAGNALRSLTGTIPEPRRMGVARLIDGEGEEIDRALVARIKSEGIGSRAAWGDLLTRYQDRLFAICLRRATNCRTYP